MLNYVTVTGTFDDGSGNPIPAVGQTAYCLFTPSTAVYASGVPLITPAQPIQAAISNGALSQRLLATDNAGLTFGGLTGFFFWTVTMVINGQAQPAWSFFLPHTPSPVDLSALANTAAGSSGFANPMTTLGDLMYENATPAAARLPGDTSNTRKFLREQSVGGVAQAPAWDTILAGDVPTLNQNTTGTAGALAPAVTFTYGSTGAAPSSGTYATGTLVVDQNSIPRVCTAGGTPGVWRRAYAQPYDFYVDDFGAKGDGVRCLVTTTATSSTITASTSVFTSTAVDGGKNIMICGAGGGIPGGPDIDTISAVTSGTVATLTGTVPAGGSGSGLACVFSSDDRIAVDNCYTAAQAYAVAHNYFARVIWSNKTYGLGTGLFQSVAGVAGATLSYNVQIRLPVGTDLTGESGKLEIQTLGPTAGAQCRFWTAVGEDAPGTVLISYSVGPNSADPTYGQQAIMGLPIGGAGIANDTGFFNVKAVVKGITLVQPGWSNSVGLDIYTAAEQDLSVTSSVFAPSTNEGGGVNPYIGWFNQSFWINNKIGAGFRLSKAQNNDQCEYDLCVQGLNIAVVSEADHIILKRLSVAAVDSVIKLNLGGNTQHAIEGRVSAENYNNGLLVTGSGSRLQCHLTWDAEMTNGVIASFDVNDANNQLFGDLWWSDFSRATGGLANIIVPAVSGAANLRIHNVMLTRQVYDAHAYAYTLGTAFVNPWWEDVWVSLAGGTVTNVQIGPTSAAATTSLATATPVTFRLPSGWWLNITGTVKPTTFLAIPD